MPRPDARQQVDRLSIGGAVAMLVTLPLLVYYLWICLADNRGALIVPTTAAAWGQLLGRVPAPTPTAAAIVLGWLLIQGLLYLYAPGKLVNGMPLADGSRLAYKVNGWSSWWLTWAALATLVWMGWIPPTVVADQLGPLLTVANLVAFALGAYLLARGGEHRVAQGPGHALHRFVVGSALDPRIGRFDFKFFCEGRPGLIGWIAINLSLAAKQYEIHGTVTTPMILVNAFALLYVADYFFHEEAILTTWDIRHEKFGWMLCWGNLVWVPFTFTIQAQYLVSHPHELPLWGTVALVGLDLAGYAIFRSANLQKHRFRRDPAALIWGRRPDYITTANGSPAAGVRLVGHGAAPELPGRPGDGTGLVPALSVRPPAAVFLRPLLRRRARAPRAARPRDVRREVRPGLGGVLPPRSLADPAGHLLSDLHAG